MVGDTEAVRLVADALHHIQSLRGTGEDDRIRRAWYKNLLVLFGQPYRRNIDMQFLQNLQDCAELPLATIDYHEVGHRPVMLQWSVLLSLSIVVALFVVSFPAEASTQHLLVAGKIVWT